jgi:hypothetical protein
MQPIDTSSANSAGTSENTGLQATSGPQGIGMAVAFDWGLATQFAVTPFLPTILGALGILKPTPSIQIPGVIVALIGTVILAFLGESVRSGRRWARIVQLVFNSLGFLGGVVSLVIGISSILHGHLWSLVTIVILAFISPIIAWRLSRPVTAQWFKMVTAAEARKRHSGAWPWLIFIWSFVGGVLVALSAILGSR